MYEEKVVLCGANSYTEKYYLNPDFEQLPDDIKNELKIMCVLYVHDVGGILTLVYEEDGSLCFEVASGVPAVILPGVFPGGGVVERLCCLS